MVDIKDGQEVEYRVAVSGLNGVQFSPWKQGTVNITMKGDKRYISIDSETEFMEANYQKPTPQFPNGIYVKGTYYMEIKND